MSLKRIRCSTVQAVRIAGAGSRLSSTIAAGKSASGSSAAPDSQWQSGTRQAARFRFEPLLDRFPEPVLRRPDAADRAPVPAGHCGSNHSSARRGIVHTPRDTTRLQSSQDARKPPSSTHRRHRSTAPSERTLIPVANPRLDVARRSPDRADSLCVRPVRPGRVVHDGDRVPPVPGEPRHLADHSARSAGRLRSPHRASPSVLRRAPAAE